MQVKQLLLIFAALGLGSPLAQAGTVFDINGVFQSGATMTGTITIDTATGVGQAADVFVTSPDAGEYQFIQSQFSPDPVTRILQLAPVAIGFPHLILAFPVSDFIGYAGSDICWVFGPCGGASNWNDGSSADGLASGTATAQAPEPGAAGLLALGLVMVAAGRRRVRVP